MPLLRTIRWVRVISGRVPADQERENAGLERTQDFAIDRCLLSSEESLGYVESLTF